MHVVLATEDPSFSNPEVAQNIALYCVYIECMLVMSHINHNLQHMKTWVIHARGVQSTCTNLLGLFSSAKAMSVTPGLCAVLEGLKMMIFGCMSW